MRWHQRLKSTQQIEIQASHLAKYEQVKTLGKEEYGKEEFDMCRAIQEMIEDGREEGRLEGRTEGWKDGWKDGAVAVNELIHRLFTEGKIDELLRSSQDLDYQRELMKAYGIQ